MAILPMNLRLEAANGSGIDEYRIDEGAVEVRKLRSGENQPADDWERLTPTQLTEHVKDGTVVAHWLRQRLGWRRLLRACVNPETLEEFGVAENTLDRYAA